MRQVICMFGEIVRLW